MKFSERIGIIKAKDSIQIDSIDSELKNGLWNIFHSYYLENFSERHIQYCGEYEFILDIWHNFFKKTIDKIPPETRNVKNELRTWFFQCEWYETYDFIEFCTKNNLFDIDSIISFYNSILEREVSGYRFVNGLISPITSESEIEEIDQAIDDSKNKNLNGVKIHLENSLRMLSDRNSPDYRNSIKESISAVESMSKTLSSSSKNSLGSALDKIKGKIKLHPALEKGFKQIYGYTSDSDGIRHALMEETTCDFEDAKYMLVSCSAFVNYLIAKGVKAKLLE
jgi:hypothetical protein